MRPNISVSTTIKPRIAVVCPAQERFDGTGGAVAQWVRAVYGYANTEYMIFCPAVSDEFGHDLKVYENKFVDVLLRAVLKLERPSSSRWAHRALAAFASKLGLSDRIWKNTVASRLRDFDIVHVHNRPEYAFYFKRLRIPARIVLHMHNDIVDYVSESASVALRDLDRVVFCSQFLEGRARSRFGLVDTRVVYNGVHANDIYVENKKEANLRQLIFVGRLIPEKGALEAIELYDRLRSLGIPYQLDMYGGSSDARGSSVYADQVREAVRVRQQRNGASSISLTTFAPHESVLRGMAEAKFLIHPCQWDEPFGMVLIEAMSQGTPPIAFSRGGMPEVVEDGVDGYLVSPDAGLDGFVQMIVSSSEQAYADLSSRAALSSRRFDWRKISDEFFRCMS